MRLEHALYYIDMFFRALKPLTFSLMICLMLLLKREQKLEKRERLVEEGCCDQIDTCQDLVNFFLTNISFSSFCYQDLAKFFRIILICQDLVNFYLIKISFLSKLVNFFLVKICFLFLISIANFLTAFVYLHIYTTLRDKVLMKSSKRA